MEHFNRTIKKNASLFLMMLLFSTFYIQTPAHGQYIHTQGTQIVGPNGQPFQMVGINLGNWLLWEGYLMMGDFQYRTHTQFFNSVKDAFGGNLQQAMEFEHQWRLNYVNLQSIAELSNMGFNSVRVPFHYNLFWNGSGLTDRGFQYFDRVINYCRDNGMYVLLDMHAAPGYQNPGDHSDNVNSNSSQPRGSVTFWDGNNVNIAAQVWRHIANRYKNEPVVWGYDLINEPVPQDGREYELLPSMITMRNAIREVDNNHIIVAEGSWWGSDMQKLDWTDPQVQSNSGVNYRWDNNLVYQTHHYTFGNAASINDMNGRKALTDKLNVPLMLGEYGEDTNTIIRQLTDWSSNNNVAYFPWSFKKMYHDRTLWTINPDAGYNNVRDFIRDGGTPPANAYNDMIGFAQYSIGNGSPLITYHSGFYNAVKYNGNSNTDPNASSGSGSGAPIGQTIWLRGTNGQYVSSENGGSGMMCNRSSVGGWEQFTVVDAGGGKIGLRGTNGLYVSSENGASAMMCNRSSIGGWEAFDWVDAGNGNIALRGTNGQYVSSEDGVSPMMCNRSSIGGWEIFSYGIVGSNAQANFNQNAALDMKTDGFFVGSVYPNPAKSGFTVSVSDPSVVKIVNVNGKIVFNAQVENDVKIDQLKSGLYLVIMTANDNVMTKKVIVE